MAARLRRRAVLDDSPPFEPRCTAHCCGAFLGDLLNYSDNLRPRPNNSRLANISCLTNVLRARQTHIQHNIVCARAGKFPATSPIRPDRIPFEGA